LGALRFRGAVSLSGLNPPLAASFAGRTTGSGSLHSSIGMFMIVIADSPMKELGRARARAHQSSPTEAAIAHRRKKRCTARAGCFYSRNARISKRCPSSNGNCRESSPIHLIDIVGAVWSVVVGAPFTPHVRGLILMGACHIPPDDTPLPPDVPPIDRAKRSAIVRHRRSHRGGYGFRLRSSSYRSKRFGVTLRNYGDNLPIRRIRSRRRQRGWRSPRQSPRPPVR
jgi:hypothetical protein